MNETCFATLDRAVVVLAGGRALRGRRRERVLGALRLAVDFPTWRTLTGSGMDDDEAADVAATFVEASGAPASCGVERKAGVVRRGPSSAPPTARRTGGRETDRHVAVIRKTSRVDGER